MNFIDMPKSAPKNIQKAAPGPPIEIEIATPAILPRPIVPDKAVASAQFFKKELEKRITKFRKIENSLKEKVKNYESQLGINKSNQNNSQNNEG